MAKVYFGEVMLLQHDFLCNYEQEFTQMKTGLGFMVALMQLAMWLSSHLIALSEGQIIFSL